MVKSVEKLEKWERWEKLEKVGKSGEKLAKVGKSGEKKSGTVTVSPRGHLFYVDFLFFIFTSHRGGNVSTAVRTFPPR